MLSNLSRGELLAVVALEVFLASLFVFAAGVAGLSPFIWLALVIASVAGQSVLFFSVGRDSFPLQRHASAARRAAPWSPRYASAPAPTVLKAGDGVVTFRQDRKVLFFDKADKSLRALLGGKGRHGFDTVNGILRLTSDSIQYRPRGYDELAMAAPLEIRLADITEVKPAYLGVRFPVWMHVVFLLVPTVLWWLFKPLGIWHRPLVSVRTGSEHYYFWVKGKRDEWIQAINEQRASLQSEQARYLRG